MCILPVNYRTPRINARGSQDSQSQRVNTAMRSTIVIKTRHTLNSKGHSWRWASVTAALGGRLKGLQNKFVTQIILIFGTQQILNYRSK